MSLDVSFRAVVSLVSLRLTVDRCPVPEMTFLCVKLMLRGLAAAYNRSLR